MVKGGKSPILTAPHVKLLSGSSSFSSFYPLSFSKHLRLTQQLRLAQPAELHLAHLVFLKHVPCVWWGSRRRDKEHLVKYFKDCQVFME